MWKNIKDMVSLWGTIGGFIGVLIVFPYINMKINEKDAAAIERERLYKIEVKAERDLFVTNTLVLIEDRMSNLIVRLDTSDQIAIEKTLYKWQKNFIEKVLPLEIFTGVSMEADKYLLLEVPVTRFDRYGVGRPDGYEYHVKVNGEYRKIKVDEKK